MFVSPENSTRINRRRPIRNFIVLPGIQTRFIVHFVQVLLLATFLTIVAIVMTYYLKSNSGDFYFMSKDLTKGLEQKSLLTTILPTLLTVELICLLVALYIGLFASRKIAVPLYRIQMWAKEIVKGNLEYNLLFREKTECRELENSCNMLAKTLKADLDQIKEKIQVLETGAQTSLPPEKILAETQAVQEILQKYLK